MRVPDFNKLVRMVLGIMKQPASRAGTDFFIWYQ